MQTYVGWLGTIAVVAGIASIPLHRDHESARPASPCATDSSYQRLAFWVGDWEIVDSAGTHYATQRIHPVLDGCALTVEWSSGGGNKGMGMTVYDGKAGEWRQIYASNQVPSASGVDVRRSDATYHGPGVRFVSIAESAGGNLSRSRITIMPMAGRKVMQLFEKSSDGGKTWQTLFKAEHRPLPARK